MIFLIHFSKTYTKFQLPELQSLLTNHIYKILFIDETILFCIIECEIIAIDYIIDRSIFIKTISIIDFVLDRNKKTAKICPVNIAANERRNVIEDNLHFIKGFEIKMDNPDLMLMVYPNFLKNNSLIESEINLKITNENDAFIKELYDKSHIVSLFYKHSNRKIMLRYDIKYRPFIGITAMDWELSICMANMVHVQSDDIIVDPFCGSGGILLACAFFNSYVIGIDKFRNSMIGTNTLVSNVRTQLKDTCIFDNFKQINKSDRILMFGLHDVFDNDIFKSFSINISSNTKEQQNYEADDMNKNKEFFILDGIVCDPPYGDRVSLNGLKCVDYLRKLRIICDKYLKDDKRVCFFAPVNVCDSDDIFYGYKRLINIEQVLGTVTRTLFLYQK